MKNDIVFKILMENATTLSQRSEVRTLLESDSQRVNNAMIANLYNSAINKSHVDFHDIEKSKGDITKYIGYQNMLETLDIIDNIAKASNTTIKETEIVRSAISHIANFKDLFTRGYIMEKEFVIVQYNTLVLCTVYATSHIISSYVDYIKSVDKVEFKLLSNKNHSGELCIDNLDKFNKSVKSGDFSKAINTIIKTDKEEFLGGIDTVMLPVFIVGAILAIVPLLREMTFYFYYSRMKASDYLKQQADFIELNKIQIQSSTLPASKKKDVIKKQEEIAKKLIKFSDTLKVDEIKTNKKVREETKEENKKWNVDYINNQTASTDRSGFQLL